jgi:hypothetical protein
MAWPLIAPMRDIAVALACGLRAQAMAAIATAALIAVATGFLTMAGFALLAGAIGMPAAAGAFSALYFVAALASHLIGRAAKRRCSARVAAARSRGESDIALAGGLAGSARPLLPIAAFLAAFVLARRN